LTVVYCEEGSRKKKRCTLYEHVSNTFPHEDLASEEEKIEIKEKEKKESKKSKKLKKTKKQETSSEESEESEAEGFGLF
jgi:hypothetical protein